MIRGSRRIKDLIHNLARGDSDKSQMLLRHFAMERFLERLSVSRYQKNFVLKGGMLISSLIGIEDRMTRDIDTTLLNKSLTFENASRIVNEIAHIDINDGFRFEAGEPSRIMLDASYSGVRIPLIAFTEKTKTNFKIDISTGDALTPKAVKYPYGLLFENRSISLYAYNLETILAEKLQTVFSLATQNTRMRDFYDIWALTSSERPIDFPLLKAALNATQETRKTNMSIADFEMVLSLLDTSAIMRDAWGRYQELSFFARNLSWDTTLSALRSMVTSLKALH